MNENELKIRIRSKLAEAKEKRNQSEGFSETYYDGKAEAFAQMIEIVEEMEKEGK